VRERKIAQHSHLLLLPQRKETDTRDLDDLEADTGNITLGLAATTEAGDEDLVVLVDEVKATVVLEDHPKSGIPGAKWSETHRHEGGDLLAVLDELHTHALADSGVGLLGLDADLLKDDALSVGRATGRRRLEDVAERALLVALVRLRWGSAPASRAGTRSTDPAVLLAVEAELAGGLETARLVGTHDERGGLEAVGDEEEESKIRARVR
jgi:hypothetical protein